MILYIHVYRYMYAYAGRVYIFVNQLICWVQGFQKTMGPTLALGIIMELASRIWGYMRGSLCTRIQPSMVTMSCLSSYVFLFRVHDVHSTTGKKGEEEEGGAVGNLGG